MNAASSGESRPKNWETAAFALFSLGGGDKFIHTEDVALKCFELAPSSFSWVRHTHLPDKDIVRVALTDARKEKAETDRAVSEMPQSPGRARFSRSLT